MIDASEVEIREVFVHHIGNKMRQEGTITSTEPLSIKTSTPALLNYFFNHFKNSSAVYKLTHPAGKLQNAIFAICTRIFEKHSFLEETIKAAAHLYDVSDHPRIATGNLFVALFSNLKFEGRKTEGVGFFKSDHKDQFIKVDFDKRLAQLSVEEGTRVKSFDKGALVLNRNGGDGFRVLQGISHNDDASYWNDKFLKLASLNNNAENTQHLLTLFRKYSDSLGDAGKTNEKLQFLDSSFSYLSSATNYDGDHFLHTLPNSTHESFIEFKETYEKEQEAVIPGNFEVAPAILKKKKQVFRSVIKLDDHIEIKIEPGMNFNESEVIERGHDKKKERDFYKIYFKEEK